MMRADDLAAGMRISGRGHAGDGVRSGSTLRCPDCHENRASRRVRDPTSSGERQRGCCRSGIRQRGACGEANGSGPRGVTPSVGRAANPRMAACATGPVFDGHQGPGMPGSQFARLPGCGEQHDFMFRKRGDGGLGISLCSDASCTSLAPLKPIRVGVSEPSLTVRDQSQLSRPVRSKGATVEKLAYNRNGRGCPQFKPGPRDDLESTDCALCPLHGRASELSTRPKSKPAEILLGNRTGRLAGQTGGHGLLLAARGSRERSIGCAIRTFMATAA